MRHYPPFVSFGEANSETRVQVDFSVERWVEIRNVQIVIGKFLRAEIGVFDTTAAGIPELEKPYVKAIINKLHQSSKKPRSKFGY